MAPQPTFLEKIRGKGHLHSAKEARHVAEVVYRAMRDVMPNEGVDRVSHELDHSAPEIAEDL